MVFIQLDEVEGTIKSVVNTGKNTICLSHGLVLVCRYMATAICLQSPHTHTHTYTHTHIHTLTYTHTDRQTDRHTHTHTHTHAHTHARTHAHTQRERERERERDTHTQRERERKKYLTCSHLLLTRQMQVYKLTEEL